MFCHVYFYPASEFNLRFSFSRWSCLGIFLLLPRLYLSQHPQIPIRLAAIKSPFLLFVWSSTIQQAWRQQSKNLQPPSFLIFNQFTVQTVHLCPEFSFVPIICHFVSICLPSLSFLDARCSTVQSSCIHLFKVSWYPKIDHVFEKYTSVIFR